MTAGLSHCIQVTQVPTSYGKEDEYAFRRFEWCIVFDRCVLV